MNLKIRLIFLLIFSFALFTILLLQSRNFQISRNSPERLEERITEGLLYDECHCNGENFCFNGTGRKFNCSLLPYLRDLQFHLEPNDKNSNGNGNAEEAEIFAVASSSNHYGELVLAIADTQTHFPTS